LLAGILLTLVQQAQVIPLIEQAEAIEAKQSHSHEDAAIDEPQHQHRWMPQQGMERQTFTLLSNVVIALGFTLILSAGVQLTQRKINWRNGLLWGLAGFSVFFLAPALSMTPELPGMESGALGQRQLWWLMASASTAVALALLVFKPGWLAKVTGVLLLLLPHFFAVPQALEELSIPLDMLRTFFIASFIANALFWLAVGGFYGYFHNKWVQQ